ncbi:Conserved_hypothetical protein [Hexamita inflata]|uniref:Uncharacterized protein n=1 Tax=Hexamita inflata TaxID=28002 RepID=A0AA86U9C8_9EUKA|nr:Conserved hypothetical protein [Hexamita inflata]
MAENNKLFNLLIQIARSCEETPEQALAIEGQFAEQVKALLQTHKRLVDRRPSDTQQRIYQGFSAIHYAAYFGFQQVFPDIFEEEWDMVTGADVQVQAKGMLTPLAQNSSALQIALLRRSEAIISFYDQKITGDPKFRQQFLPFQNRLGATNLQVAALCFDCPAALELVENQHLIEAELPLNAATESFFSIVCTFGQLKPLNALLKNKSLLPLIYKVVLSYIGKPSYLDLCERDVDYILYQTSRTQKQQIKKRMAYLIQDALDYCVNQQDYEWKNLQLEWKKNPLYYYEEDDVSKQNGLKICAKEAQKQQQAAEMIPNYSVLDWFEGKEVELNKIQFVGQRDERETQSQNNVYNGFTLSFYCILKNRLDILKQIIDDERDITLNQNTQINQKSGIVSLLNESSLLHAAVALNAIQAVELLLKQSKAWKEANEAGETVYVQAIMRKNQASIMLIKSPQFLAQFDDEKTCLDVLKCAFENENVQVLQLFTNRANDADENQKACIFKSVFQIKDDVVKQAECKRIYKLLLRKASAYLSSKNLFTDENWKEVLEQYYGSKYDEIVKKEADLKERTFVKLAQKAEQKFSLATAPAVDDQVFDQNAQKVEMEYEDEVQSYETDLFRDANPFDTQFLPPGQKDMEEKITLMNLILDDTPEQRDAVKQIVKDDIVSKMPDNLEKWFIACAFGKEQTSAAQAMHRTKLHAVDLRPSQLTSGASSIYNGFCGMHYAVVNGNWDIVQMLFDYEFCNVTKARVLIKAHGVGQNKLAVVPIGTNCLQLAAISGQKEILALLIDEVVRRNTARLIDPIQQSFGKKPPLTVADKLKIFTMKNEFDQNILATLACCRAFYDEESIAAICLEYQTREFDVAPKQKNIDNNQCELINTQRIDQVMKLAALFTNARLIRIVRQELLSNPLTRFRDEDYCKLLFTTAQALIEVQSDTYQDLYQRELQDTVREVNSTLVLIAACLYVKQQENSQLWEQTFGPLQQDEIFSQRAEEAKSSVDFLRAPGYQTDISGQFIRIERDFLNMQNYYLDNVVQSPELNCFFDAVINGDVEFVRLCQKEFNNKIEKRQTRGKIINGFTALSYACFYRHFELIKMLLQDEYDAVVNAEPQQILVTQSQSDYQFVFKNRCNFMQAAILSGDQELVDKLLGLVREQKLIRNVVFPENEKTNIMKLAIYNKCGCIFKYGDLIKRELEAESEQLKENNQIESILYMICKEQDPYSVIQVKNLLIQLKDQKILEAFYYSTLQRLVNHNTGISMTALDWLYSTCMTQLNKQKLVPVYQQAIQFVSQLTNTALIYAFNQDTKQNDAFARTLLEIYYGEEKYAEMKKYFEEHATEFDPKEWLSEKEECFKNNYQAKIYQIESQDFDQYSNEEDLAKWFGLCSYGTGEEVKAMLKKCSCKRDLRMNNYQDHIYTGFCGLMYAILHDNIQAFEVLLNEECTQVLEQEQVLFVSGKYYYLAEGFTTLHMAALAGNQQFFDMLLKLFEAKKVQIQCVQSPSSLAIITNKEISEYQLLNDFKVDSNLFRLSVQFGRVQIIKKLIQFGRNQDNKKLFYENVFAKTQFEEEELTVLDLISSLEVDEDKQISKDNVITTKNLVRQTIANCLTEMVTQNVLENYSHLLDKFYDVSRITQQIRSEYESYINPTIVSNRNATTQEFCRITAEQLEPQSLQFTFYEHTSSEIAWFNACRVNDISFVKLNLKSFSNLTDKRQTQPENKIHRGFTGLMYAACYGAVDVLQILIEIEYETLLDQDTVVQIEQQMYFIPKHSSVLHIALCTSNDQIIQRTLTKIRQTSFIYAESNSLQFTAFVLMSGLNQCYDQLIDQFITRMNKFEALLVFNNAVQVNNYQLVKKLINISQKNQQIKEIMFEFVFDVSQRAPTQPNEAESLLLKQQEIAIVYALKNRGDKWDKCLKNMFGDDLESVKKEHEEVQKFNKGSLVTIPEEQLMKQFNIVTSEQINHPPQIDKLPKSQLQEEQLKWFEACKTGDVQFVKQNLEKFKCIVDDRASLEKGYYPKFTGLMYATISGQFDVFQTLLPFEMNITLARPSVIQLLGDRYYVLEVGSTITNIASVCGQQRIYTWMLQQKDNRLYSGLYRSLCTNKCLVQAVLGDIYFNEDIFINILSQASSENIIAQLFLLGAERYCKKINTFVDICGTDDKYVQNIFILALNAIEFLEKGVTIDQKDEFKILIDKAITHAITQYKQQIWKNLMRKNMTEKEIQDRIEQFKQDQQKCDCIKEEHYEALVKNCFIVNDPVIQIAEDKLPRDEPFQDEYVDEWFLACKEGALDFIERSINDCKGSFDKRRLSRNMEIFQGWSAIHYAAYFGQLEVVKYLYQHEMQLTTLMDCVIDAPGIGYGIDYLCSRGSNLMQIAILGDNFSVVQWLVQRAEVDTTLQTVLMQPNARRHSTMCTAALAWRSRSGQLFLQSKVIQLEIGQIKRKYDSLNIIQVIRFTNCAYLGKNLFMWLQNDNQLKAIFYQMLLETELYTDGEFGTQLEKQYTTSFYNYILRDSMNYCLKQKDTVQWSGTFDNYCQKHKIMSAAVVIQFTRTDTVTTEDYNIFVPEEYIEIAQKKLKPVQISSGSSLKQLPTKKDTKKLIQDEWATLNSIVDQIESGKAE